MSPLVKASARVGPPECHAPGTPRLHAPGMEQRWTEADGLIVPARAGAREPLALHWRHGDATVDFRELALVDPTMEHGGVYVIHRAGHAHRLGQATRVRDRLRSHQRDPKVVRSMDAALSVTWALVPRAYRDGVEAYLGRVLRPGVAERFPTVPPIPVNLPQALRAAARPVNVGQPMRSALTVPGGERSVVTSAFLERTVSNMELSSTEESEPERLAQALETLAWLHAKDAKNSDTHWSLECAMCGVIADAEPLLARRWSKDTRRTSA